MELLLFFANYESFIIPEIACHYNPLQIFLQQIGSQEIKPLMVQSTIGPFFSGDDLPRHAACILLELPSIASGLLQKPVPPPLPWFRHDASVLFEGSLRV